MTATRHFIFPMGVLLACLQLAGSPHAENPLRGGDFSRLVSGPALEEGALEGRVVLLEYFGYR